MIEDPVKLERRDVETLRRAATASGWLAEPDGRGDRLAAALGRSAEALEDAEETS